MIWRWLIGLGITAILLLAAGWAGAKFGRSAAKKYPGLALGLIMFAGFFRLDPPPPPRAERVFKDEEDEEAAGAPPAPPSQSLK